MHFVVISDYWRRSYLSFKAHLADSNVIIIEITQNSSTRKSQINDQIMPVQKLKNHKMTI